MVLNFLQEIDDKVIFNSEGKLEILIPKSFFEDELAEEFGTEIKVFGCFEFRYFPKKDEKTYQTYQIFIPEFLSFTFSDWYKNKLNINTGDSINLDENEESDVDMYYIYILYKNDLFITSTNITSNFRNTEKLVKLHETGRIPNTIDYKDYIKLYIENLSANKVDFGIPLVVLESMISELARYNKDIEIPFRKMVGKSGVKDNDFKQISMLNLAMITGTFSAVTSENINKAFICSISRTKDEKEEKPTSIEKNIKY